ncbi:MAG: class I SAM-dependent methyltransferase, partial [Actinomycetota bacterium]
DRAEEAVGPLAGRRLLDVATGTGSVAIEAARRGATVVGVDVTDELVEIATARAADAGVEVRFEIGDFDRLDVILGETGFDVITSSFGVIFAPDPSSTLAGLRQLLAPGGVIGVAGWDPDGVFVVPESMLELLPERPAMPDMATWTTAIGSLAERAGCEVLSSEAGELVIPFGSVDDGAEQLERWSGGWGQLLELFDSIGVGDDARARFVDHLDAFSSDGDSGIVLHATFHTSVLGR